MKSSICEGLPKFTVGEDQAIKIMFWDQNRNDVIVTPSLEFLNMSFAYSSGSQVLLYIGQSLFELAVVIPEIISGSKIKASRDPQDSKF